MSQKTFDMKCDLQYTFDIKELLYDIPCVKITWSTDIYLHPPHYEKFLALFLLQIIFLQNLNRIIVYS